MTGAFIGWLVGMVIALLIVAGADLQSPWTYLLGFVLGFSGWMLGTLVQERLR